MITYTLSDLESRELMKGLHGRAVHSERMSFMDWHIEEGADLPEHSHEHEQVAIILTGRFQFTISGETQVAEAGQMVVIPSNAVHSGKALSECRIIDAFAPVREDYR